MVCSARGKHELGSALFATAGALFFGLGFGRVLQRVHARAWALPLPKRGVGQALYATVLLGLYRFLLVLVLQPGRLRSRRRLDRLLVRLRAASTPGRRPVLRPPSRPRCA